MIGSTRGPRLALRDARSHLDARSPLRPLRPQQMSAFHPKQALGPVEIFACYRSLELCTQFEHLGHAVGPSAAGTTLLVAGFNAQRACFPQAQAEQSIQLLVRLDMRAALFAMARRIGAAARLASNAGVVNVGVLLGSHIGSDHFRCDRSASRA